MSNAAAPTDPQAGWFGILDIGDLYFVKTRRTGPGRAEIHIATRNSNYGASGVDLASRFGAGEANNGSFGVLG